MKGRKHRFDPGLEFWGRVGERSRAQCVINGIVVVGRKRGSTPAPPSQIRPKRTSDRTCSTTGHQPSSQGDGESIKRYPNVCFKVVLKILSKMKDNCLGLLFTFLLRFLPTKLFAGRQCIRDAHAPPMCCAPTGPGDGGPRGRGAAQLNSSVLSWPRG